MKSVTASAPAKVNLIFEVGNLDGSGYHEVNSLFLALDLRERVRISPALQGTGITIFVSGENLPGRHIAAVPTDDTNLVSKVIKLMATKWSIQVPDIQIDIFKRIPVAGGMAGGSADAAAMLVAFNEYSHQNLGTERLSSVELLELGSALGSDVPFGLLGELAIGTGRGDQVSALKPFGFPTHWVIAISQQGLSTPSVYRKHDELQTPSKFRDLCEIAASIGDVSELADYLSNDLEKATLELMPSLATLKRTIEEMGALKAIVSGSGPTVAALCKSEEDAEQVAKELTQLGIFALTAHSPTAGANLEP